MRRARSEEDADAAEIGAVARRVKRRRRLQGELDVTPEDRFTFLELIDDMRGEIYDQSMAMSPIQVLNTLRVASKNLNNEIEIIVIRRIQSEFRAFMRKLETFNPRSGILDLEFFERTAQRFQRDVAYVRACLPDAPTEGEARLYGSMLFHADREAVRAWAVASSTDPSDPVIQEICIRLLRFLAVWDEKQEKAEEEEEEEEEAHDRTRLPWGPFLADWIDEALKLPKGARDILILLQLIYKALTEGSSANVPPELFPEPSQWWCLLPWITKAFEKEDILAHPECFWLLFTLPGRPFEGYVSHKSGFLAMTLGLLPAHKNSIRFLTSYLNPDRYSAARGWPTQMRKYVVRRLRYLREKNDLPFQRAEANTFFVMQRSVNVFSLLFPSVRALKQLLTPDPSVEVAFPPTIEMPESVYPPVERPITDANLVAMCIIDPTRAFVSHVALSVRDLAYWMRAFQEDQAPFGSFKFVAVLEPCLVYFFAQMRAKHGDAGDETRTNWAKEILLPLPLYILARIVPNVASRFSQRGKAKLRLLLDEKARAYMLHEKLEVSTLLSTKGAYTRLLAVLDKVELLPSL